MFFHPRESESKLVLLQFLFKKYLEYEKSVGDEERIESVKRKAIEYVESSMAWPSLLMMLSNASKTLSIK